MPWSESKTLQMEKEASRPPQRGAAEPLSEAEMNTIRETIKELKGAARVWDVLSQEKLTHRSSEDLRTLYYQQGYGAAAGGNWRKIGEQSSLRGESHLQSSRFLGGSNLFTGSRPQSSSTFTVQGRKQCQTLIWLHGTLCAFKDITRFEIVYRSILSCRKLGRELKDELRS